MTPLVLYHACCMDGFAAAWVVHKKYPDAEFKAVSYSDLPPDVAGRDVIMVDFSYQRAVLQELKSKAASLQVFDHHKTAQEDLIGLSYCQFDINKSGARITWDMLFPTQQPPTILLYVEDRDLWRFVLPHSKDINAALASYPMDFDVWDKLETKSINELIAEGSAILRYQAQLIDQISSQAEEVKLEDQIVLAVNSPILQSEIGAKLAKGHPFGIVWFEKQGKRIYSLRSTQGEGVDVGDIAKRHGGGGHRHASGFSVELKKFLSDLFIKNRY